MNTFERDQKAAWEMVLQVELAKRLPDDASVPAEVVSHWLDLAGEHLAERKGYTLHRRSDALRFHAHSEHGVPLKEAMALSEEELVWMFQERMTMLTVGLRCRIRTLREHLSVVNG